MRKFTIDWSGEITAGLAVFDFGDPQNPVPEDIGISAVLGKYPSWRHTAILGGKSTYPNSEPFDIRLEFMYGPMPLSELYDGKGEIRISYSAIIFPGYFVDPGSFTLNNVKLVIEGNVIPEPATILLLSMGLMGMRLRRKNS